MFVVSIATGEIVMSRWSRVSGTLFAVGAALGLSLLVSTARAADTLAAYAPGEKLIALFEFDGLEGHRAAWGKTAAWRALHETKLGELVGDLAGQAFDIIQKANPNPQKTKVSKDEFAKWVDHVKDHGFLVAFFGDPQSPTGLAVIRGAGQGEPSRVMATLFGPGKTPKAEPVEKAGRMVHSFGQNSSWWVEGDDLILVETKGLDAVLAAIDGKGPKASNSPIRAALAKPRDGFEPVAVGFFDLAQLGPPPPDFENLGLAGVKRIEFQWGFHGDALESFTRLVAPAPRRGMLSLLDQPAFTIDSLPPIPAGQTSFTALSFDLLKSYDQIAAISRKMDPAQAKALDASEKRVNEALGLDLRDDLLKPLGPQVVTYMLPVQAPQFGLPNPMITGITNYAGLVVGVQTKDEKAVGEALGRVVELINKQVAEQMKGNPNPPQFAKGDGPGVEYVMNLAGIGMPPLLEQTFSPTITVGNGQLIVSGSRDAARKALDTAKAAPGERWKATEAFMPLVERLPKEMIVLSVSDIRETLPEMLAGLPLMAAAFNAQVAPMIKEQGGPDVSLVVDPAKVPPADQLRALLFPASSAISVDDQGVTLHQRESLPSISSPAAAGTVVALLLPAVQAAREAARRAPCVNNLKQICLALHNYESANGHFPGDITDKDGKPLLSWRVAILPYMEQNELYNEFKLDEPWDSPHNKPLLDKIPMFYHCPSQSYPDPTLTNYQGFEGKGTFFEKGTQIKLASFTDGTSNTLAVVEAAEGAPWTKPADLHFDENAPPSFYGAGMKHAMGFNALFADGSVRFIKLATHPTVLKALITRNGGEVINADSF